MTLSILCAFVPMLFISPFAGVWADRFDRKRLIILSDAGIALCTLILAIVFILGYGSVWLLFAASAIRSFGSGIQLPAVSAFLPQLVPQEMLTRINAINGTIQSTMTLLSPMLSAALLTVASIEAIFFVDVVTAAVAIFILIVYLPVSAHDRAIHPPATDYFADLREGTAYIKRHDFLKAFFLFNALFLIFMGPMAFLTPLQVARTFGEEVWRLSALEVAFSAGMVVGGILMASWGGFANKLYSMATATLIFGLCTVMLGIPPSFWTYIALMGVVGIVIPMFNTPATVLLQERVEGAFLGRIFGVNTMIASSLMPLSMLLYGPLADMIRIETMLLVTGVLLVLQGALMMANSPLRQAGEPLPSKVSPNN